MVFVRIHGKAKSDQLTTSPVTHTLCRYYAVELEMGRNLDSRRLFYGRRRRRKRNVVALTGLGHAAGLPRRQHGTRAGESDRQNISWIDDRDVCTGGATASSFAAGGATDIELSAYVARVGSQPHDTGSFPPSEWKSPYPNIRSTKSTRTSC